MVSYTVLLYPSPNYSTSTDISTDILSIPVFTDTGDGEINTAVIRLNDKNAQYSLSVNEHDRVKLTITDDNSNVYTRSFEVMTKVSIRNKLEAPTLQLELAGIEIALKRVKVSVNTFALSTRDLFTFLMTCYNNNKTASMPTITYTASDIPDIMSNLDWSAEDTILNRLNELVDSFGASGENNGVLDYFDMRFTTTSVTAITVAIFSSGLVAGSPETITNSISFESKIEPPLVSQVGVWGAPDAGSLPVEWSKFSGKQQIMPNNTGSKSNFPLWVSGQKYPIESKIQWQGSGDKIYRKKTTNITTNLSTQPQSNTTDWVIYTTSDFYGTSFSYSPWTSNKLQIWKNNGAGFTSSPFAITTGNNKAGNCFFDGNLIVNDSSDENASFRTWVDLKTTTSLINAYWLYAGSQLGVYDGLRVLVDGTGTGEFVGNNNNIMEYNGKKGTWGIKYTPKTDMLVAVIDQARVFRYNGTAWEENLLGNGVDCFHPYTDIMVDVSAIKDPDADITLLPAQRQYPSAGVGTPRNNNSAISVTYGWNSVGSFISGFADSISATPAIKNNFYSSGAWLTFRLPFPINTNGGISEEVGELYGGTNTGNKIPYLDLENSTYTHTGQIGYNEIDSEDLGQISSINFYMKLEYLVALTAGGGLALSKNVLAGNFPMQCFLIDKNDHVVVQDFNMEFNNTWQSISLPVGGFSLYRGRKPKNMNTLLNIVPPKDLEYSAIFESRHVRIMCVNTKDSYDEFGRYSPATNMFGGSELGGLLAGQARRIKLSIDCLRFTKPLLAMTDVLATNSTSTLKQSDFLHHPNIFVYDQLEGDAYSELLKQSFSYEEYNIVTSTKFLTTYGKSFLFTDATISHTDGLDGGGVRNESGANNTVALVAKHIEYSITKPVNNIGGMIRKIRGIRRFI